MQSEHVVNRGIMPQILLSRTRPHPRSPEQFQSHISSAHENYYAGEDHEAGKDSANDHSGSRISAMENPC